MKKEIDFWKKEGNNRLNHRMIPQHIPDDSIKLAKAGIGLAIVSLLLELELLLSRKQLEEIKCL